MPRRADLDRGGAPVPVGKNPEMLDEADKRSRDDTRGGLRELDRMVENQGGLSRHVKDENRALPRDGTGSVRSRRLPTDGEPRRITAYRQRILNTQKTAFGREKVPVRVRRAFAAVFGSDARELARINDVLADNVGDIEGVDEDTARKVRRVDRALRMGEAHNSADNIVYTPIRPPHGVNSGNVASWLHRNFADGTEVNFDRYTVTSHSAFEADGSGAAGVQWRPLCEIVTRRGVYVGNAPTSKGPHPHAGHYLPRGMRLRCIGVKTIPVAAPDGTTYERIVLQLEDLDD